VQGGTQLRTTSKRRVALSKGFCAMVMPMTSPPLAGPPTPEMLEKLKPIKFAVVGIWCAAIGRMCTGDMPLGDIMCGVTGVFLFRDDPGFVACYRCMHSLFGQCAGQGGGGLQCVMPFLFISIMNCLFMTFRLFNGGPFLLLSFFCQLSGGALAYQLNMLISHTLGSEGGGPGGGFQSQPMLNQPWNSMRLGNLNPQTGARPGGLPGAMGGGGMPGAMGGSGGMGGNTASGTGGGPAGGAANPGSRPFVPFAGSGQRLDS